MHTHTHTHMQTHTLHMHTIVYKHLPSTPSTHTHTHTHTTTNTSITNGRWKRRETTNRYAEETRWDFSFHLNEYPREKGREFQMTGPMYEKISPRGSSCPSSEHRRVERARRVEIKQLWEAWTSCATDKVESGKSYVALNPAAAREPVQIKE